LKSWRVEPRDIFLIFTRRGTDIEKYPAIKNHLATFKENLEPKPSDWPSNKKWNGRKSGIYKWFEIQDTVAYWNKYEDVKIFYPEFSQAPCFSIDRSKIYSTNKCFIIPDADFFLLGVLNSNVNWLYGA
jgi:adenine-specific DNA-methyltransferase